MVTIEKNGADIVPYGVVFFGSAVQFGLGF